MEDVGGGGRFGGDPRSTARRSGGRLSEPGRVGRAQRALEHRLHAREVGLRPGGRCDRRHRVRVHGRQLPDREQHLGVVARRDVGAVATNAARRRGHLLRGRAERVDGGGGVEHHARAGRGRCRRHGGRRSARRDLATELKRRVRSRVPWANPEA